ncbi:CUE domain-containing protein [Mycena venus]|uniref:CUE domain-containing protein n=1 Tax=Mycena venus TaxID=2733690 RepID=A0A8H6YKN5_9AGAR|nr:CUE domain-containing protein [Mycena venus]
MSSHFSDHFSPEIVSTVATVGALALVVKYLWRDSRSTPPGPRGLPVIGNWLNIPRREQWLVYQEWSRRYGSDIIHMNVLGKDILVVNSAKAASALGLMTYQQTSDANARGTVKLSTTIVLAHSYVPSPGSDSDGTLVLCLMARIGGYTTFDKPNVQPSGQPDPFIGAAVQAVEALTETGLFGTYLVDFLPILKYVPSWFPFATFKRQANKWHKSSDIAAHVPFDLSKSAIATNDYLPSINSKILTADEFNDETTVRQATAAMFANGSAATVSALITFILAMRLYPEVQAKARKEIDQVVSGRLPNFSDEATLPYITAIIRELGRWNPVVPLSFPHMLSTDDEYNGYHLKAGSVVFPNAWAILHDPAVYPEPHVFKPERFLTPDGKLNPQAKDPEAPWGFGRRVCPGRKMATSTMFIAIASILATFEITAAIDSNGSPIEPSAEYGSATKNSIAAGLLATAALPAAKRDTPAARNFISTYVKDQARITLESLIWQTPVAQDDKLIHKRALVLAQKLADGLDLQTLVDLSIIYARTNATQARAIMAAGLAANPPEVQSELLPALTMLLSSSQGLYALRKTSFCISSFLHVCPTKTLRVFTQSKDFIVALAKAYDAGLSTLAHSYGGLSVSDSREADEWERIWVETKVSLVDAFHVIVRALLDDMASSSGPVLAVEADRTFDIIFTLLSLPSSSQQPNAGQTPFLDRSLLADYQQTYDLSRTLASSLRHAEEKDARVELLESSLQSINSSSEKEPGALKILLRSSGIAPGVDNLGKGYSKVHDTKGKAKDVSLPTTAAPEDPELDLKVTQVLDILPEHEPEYIRALLMHPSYTTPEKVVEALLEGTAPIPKELAASAAKVDEISSYVRRNVYDDDMDLARVRIGKKTENESVLRDRTFIEQMKADILRRAEEISDDEEEEDVEDKTGAGKGKAKEHVDDGDLDLDATHIKVAGDGEESGGEDGDGEEEEALSPETICELAYIRDPKLFDRDAQTRRGKARADLKAQTGWSDEQLEGWKIMLERNPKKDKILQKHEFAGNQNEIVPEAGGESSRGGPQRGGERGRGARGARGGGRGRGGGASGDGARERAWKDKNKASRGNHNRKRGHDKKMARAGGPS